MSTAVLLCLWSFLLPQISTDKIPVEFSYNNPKAKTVFVAGDFNMWSTTAAPLHKNQAGIWTTTVLLKPGRCQYKFIVDGVWTADPANPEKGNLGPGGPNSVRIVTADSTASATPAAGPVPAAAAVSAVRLGNVQLVPGQIVEFELPVSTNAWRAAARLPRPTSDAPLSSNPKIDFVRAAICAPAGFDPAKSYPLLVVGSTINASCTEHLRHYCLPASAGGWVALAADAPLIPKEGKDDSNAYRWAMLGAALEYLHTNWPASRNWPVACAGFSGGAKRSGYIGAIMMAANYNVIGMWMGGCNEDMASRALEMYRPSARFHNVPIFLSSGKRDTTAAPEQVANVMHEMRNKGFHKLRLERYDGAHDPSPGQIKLALAWFLEEAKK